MFGSKTNYEGDEIRDESNIIGQHLLLNYCFSHRHSSMLLCPSTHGALINHDSISPNAEYQWSSSWDATTKQWLNMSYHDIEQQFSKGLSMDIIATRDILAGEEILFDYGIEWREAWNKHVETYTSQEKGTAASSYQMNKKLHQIRTITEQKINPYPSNIMTVCYYHEEELEPSTDGSESMIEPLLSDYDNDNGDILLSKFLQEKEQLEDSTFTFNQFVQNDSIAFVDIPFVDDSQRNSNPFIPYPQGKSYWPCKAYEKNESSALYTVRIYQSPNYEDTDWTEEKSFQFAINYPREYIHYVNRPYKSDFFLRNAFRHAIHIHDHLFPDAWKNLLDY